MNTGSWVCRWVNWGSGRLPPPLASSKTKVPASCLACLPTVPCWPPSWPLFSWPQREEVVFTTDWSLFLCFPIIDSNSSYRRPPKENMFCSLNLRLPHGATVVGAHSREESVGWLFPWLFYFFSISLSGDNKTCFPFSPKEIGTFLLTTCYLKFIFLLRLSWIGWVVLRELQNKALSFILLKGQSSQPKFAFIWRHRPHWNSPWLSHQRLYTRLKWLYYPKFTSLRLQDWVNVQTANTLVNVNGYIEFTETDTGVWCEVGVQESFLPHVHFQRIQHHLFKPSSFSHCTAASRLS